MSDKTKFDYHLYSLLNFSGATILDSMTSNRCPVVSNIPDDAVDRRKLGFQFKQQCKASIEQFLYIFNMLLKDNINRLFKRASAH